MSHPNQELYYDDEGTIRFRENAIVSFMLKHGSLGLNDLALMPFSKDDRMQFAQLIGYSLGGFGELNYVSDEKYEECEVVAEQMRRVK